MSNIVCHYMRPGYSTQFSISSLAGHYTPTIPGKKIAHVDWGSYFLSSMPPLFIDQLKQSTWVGDTGELEDLINVSFNKTSTITRTATLEWVKTNAGKQMICWDYINMSKYIETHATLLSAIADLITRPESAKYGQLGLRFSDLPPGWLNHLSLHCLQPDDPDYDRIAHVVERGGEGKQKPKPHLSMAKFRDIVRDYNHPFMRAVLHASLSKYTCKVKTGCQKRMERGKPFLPRNFATYRRALISGLTTHTPICITFGDVKVPEDHLWIDPEIDYE